MQFWNILGKILLVVGLFLALNLAISIPLAIIGASMAAPQHAAPGAADIADQLTKSPLLQTISFSLSSAMAIVAAAAAYFFFERKFAWPLGWKERRWFRNLVLGLILGALFISIGFAVVLALGGARVAAVSITPETAYTVALGLILFIVVGFSEEIFSRGYIYGLVKHHYGIIAAIAVSSILFALMHSMNANVFSNPLPMLNIGLAGIMLALLREMSGGLWMPIGVHITWNFFQGNVYGMAVSGMKTDSIVTLEVTNAFIAGGAFGLEGSLVNTVTSLLICAILTTLLIRREKRAVI